MPKQKTQALFPYLIHCKARVLLKGKKTKERESTAEGVGIGLGEKEVGKPANESVKHQPKMIFQNESSRSSKSQKLRKNFFLALATAPATRALLKIYAPDLIFVLSAIKQRKSKNAEAFITYLSLFLHQTNP